MDLLVTIGLDAPDVAALDARLDARVVAYPSIPTVYALDGIVRVESARVAGRMLEPRGVNFYGYFDAPCYESDDWRKNVGSTTTVVPSPDPALLSQARAVAGHLGLEIAGIDFIVNDHDAFLLEVNAYPGLVDVPDARAAFVERAAAWWERTARAADG